MSGKRVTDRSWRLDWNLALGTGLVLGLYAGLLDISLSMLSQPVGLATLGALPPVLLATAVPVCAVYLMVWWLAARPLSIAGGLDTGGAAVCTAVLLGMSWTVALLSGLQNASLTPPNVFRYGIVATLAAAVSPMAYGAWMGMQRYPAWATRGRAYGVALPVFLGQLVVWQWIELYQIEAASPASAVVTLLLGAGWIVTAGVLWSAHGPARAERLLLGFVGCLVLAVGAADRYAAPPSYAPVEASPSGRSPRNILMITVDTLRADALSVYARRGVPTPRLERLAQDSVLFERAVSAAPWTLPALSSIMTGLSPSVHVVTELSSRLSDRVVTLGEYLRQAGYHTGAIVSNELLGPRSNLAQGYRDYRYLHQSSYGDSIGGRVLRAVLPTFYPSPWPSTTDVTDQARAWIEHHQHDDFFLWVHYFDPHAPYAPPPGYLDRVADGMPAEVDPILDDVMLVVPSAEDQRWIRELYDAEVRYVDDSLGDLFDSLKRLGLYDDTLIIFTSDHGEEFWEHGGQGHGHSQYNELLSVPLLIKLPGPTQTGRVSQTVSTTSLMPTVLDLAGIAYDPSSLSSPSLASVLSDGGEGVGDVPIVSTAQMLFERKDAVFLGQSKYIGTTDDDRPLLFRLDQDAAERTSVAATHPGLVERAQAILSRHHETSVALRQRLGIEEEVADLDEDTLERLRGLGYVR